MVVFIEAPQNSYRGAGQIALTPNVLNHASSGGIEFFEKQISEDTDPFTCFIYDYCCLFSNYFMIRQRKVRGFYCRSGNVSRIRSKPVRETLLNPTLITAPYRLLCEQHQNDNLKNIPVGGKKSLPLNHVFLKRFFVRGLFHVTTLEFCLNLLYK